MSHRPARTSVTRRVQNLLKEDASISSSESSPELGRLNSNSKKYTSHRPPTDPIDKGINYRTNIDKSDYASENQKVNQSRAGEKKSAQKSKTLVSESDHRAHSRNRSFDGKLSAKKTLKSEGPTHITGSCQKEKYILKSQVGDLQETVVKQGKKLKILHKKMIDKRQEINKLTEQVLASRKKTGIILELEEKVKAAEETENHLMSYLKEQQKVAKEALRKLHELQEESATEIEKAKQYYKDYYQKQAEEERDLYEERLRRSEIERERLIAIIKDLEVNLNTEKSYSSKSSVLNSEVAILKSELNEKLIENERIKFENRGLKQTIEENKKLASMEIKDLKYELEMLNEQSRNIKTNEEESYIRENALLRRNVEELEQQLCEKDSTYRDQIGLINQKVLNLQNELRKLTEYEEKIERLNKEVLFKDEEVQMIKKYYKEKLEKAKMKQKDQKKEWSNIYNELLGEIKQLKGDIDALGHENKRLISSIKTKTIKDSY